ncbi:glycosyltransferase family 4 protein [Variovorax defluvii]|uniref:Glycosyltransferase family 4 protein n=1 Tax=Variovorax defluvii TaxID=913761 RepID=A0ABP8HDI6_9BURK
MKFVFFTPFAVNSAIGRVTALLIGALDRMGHSAVVVRTERQELLGSPAHASPAPVLPWDDESQVLSTTRDADALIYQIGNNYAFHHGGLHWLARLPGIVCLHDFLLAHLFADWAAFHRSQAESVLDHWYGEQAPIEFFEAACSTPEGFADTAARHYPMTEWICAQALAVVSHSHWGMQRVANACAGPLRVVPLPYDAPGAARAPGMRKDDKVRILTVGHVNSNKRIDSVIRAIGASPLLRDAVTYQLCGLIQSAVKEELSALASSLGVELLVSGETDDAALQRAMLEADIACCLRWPSFEAASATTIEGLLYGKAVVVTDAAFYAELPDDCVRKVAPIDEDAGLRAVLEDLVADAPARVAMARRGQAWAARTFSADGYAAELVGMARHAAAAWPVLDMAETLSGLLASWQASSALMAADDIADPLALFQVVGRLPPGAASADPGESASL